MAIEDLKGQMGRLPEQPGAYLFLGAAGETLTLRHDSTGRDSFMPGVILAVRVVMTRSELVVGLDTLVGLK